MGGSAAYIDACTGDADVLIQMLKAFFSRSFAMPTVVIGCTLTDRGGQCLLARFQAITKYLRTKGELRRVEDLPDFQHVGKAGQRCEEVAAHPVWKREVQVYLLAPLFVRRAELRSMDAMFFQDLLDAHAGLPVSRIDEQAHRRG